MTGQMNGPCDFVGIPPGLVLSQDIHTPRVRLLDAGDSTAVTDTGDVQVPLIRIEQDQKSATA